MPETPERIPAFGILRGRGGHKRDFLTGFYHELRHKASEYLQKICLEDTEPALLTLTSSCH